MRPNLHVLYFFAFLVLMGALGSTHFLTGKSRTSGATLSIITPHGDNIRQEIGTAFTEWHARRFEEPINIKWIDQGGTSDALKFVQSRFSQTPASIGIDLFFGGGTPPFRALARDGWLVKETVSEAALLGIPPFVGGVQVYSREEGWYGVALSGFGIVYNRKLLEAERLTAPTGWTDLAHPDAKGWVASVDPRGSGSAHVIYEIILQKYGWETGWGILTRIAANSSRFTKGASAVLPILTGGEAAYTIAIDLYAWSLIEQFGDEVIGFIMPAGETVVTPDPIGILKGAPNAKGANRFVEFLLSEECQRIWMFKAGTAGGPKRQSLHRMSVRPGLYSEAGTRTLIRGNPFQSTGQDTWNYSDSLTESRWIFVNDALGVWMVDHHTEARDVWDNLQRRGYTEGWTQERNFLPPANWEDVQPWLIDWSREGFRNQTMARWSRYLSRRE